MVGSWVHRSQWGAGPTRFLFWGSGVRSPAPRLEAEPAVCTGTFVRMLWTLCPCLLPASPEPRGPDPTRGGGPDFHSDVSRGLENSPLLRRLRDSRKWWEGPDPTAPHYAPHTPGRIPGSLSRQVLWVLTLGPRHPSPQSPRAGEDKERGCPHTPVTPALGEGPGRAGRCGPWQLGALRLRWALVPLPCCDRCDWSLRQSKAWSESAEAGLAEMQVWAAETRALPPTSASWGRLWGDAVSTIRRIPFLFFSFCSFEIYSSCVD